MNPKKKLNELKKPRKFWATDSEHRRLMEEALKTVGGGKGCLSRFLSKIADPKIKIIFIEGSGNLELHIKTS